MNVTIFSIPYGRMRYQSLGDYEWIGPSGEHLEVTVAQLPDWRHEFLIAVHELIEEALTRHRGIPEPAILAFDLAHLDSDDPGNLGDCPRGRAVSGDL